MCNATGISLQIAECLEMMHTVDNLIHFDLTPENIVFVSAEVANSEDGTSGSSNDSSGRGRRAKFGEVARVAKLVDPKMTIPKTADPTTVVRYVHIHLENKINKRKIQNTTTAATPLFVVLFWLVDGTRNDPIQSSGKESLRIGAALDYF